MLTTVSRPENYFLNFQIAVFSGSVGCGVASYPDIYVRLEDPDTLKFVKKFLRPADSAKDSDSSKF